MVIDPEVMTSYWASRGNVILLESQSAGHPWAQSSLVAARPRAEIIARDDRITIRTEGHTNSFSGNPWQALQDFRAEYAGWLFGYLGYDLKNHLEQLHSGNPDPIEAPDMYFMVPDFLAEIDRQTGRVETLVGELPPEIERFESTLPDAGTCSIENLQKQTDRDTYLSMIERAQRYILEGDFYEINLSHQLAADFEGKPWALYQQMKQVGPVPFAAYLQLDEWTICSQSPERFLRKEGATVVSQPIKGTAQRGGSVAEDDELKQSLLDSPKERAENLMIVDLVRNDLSRIAQRGSVQVPELFDIQSFGTVHQMVSTVTAKAADNNPVRILQACFPMGSMTGAPKIRAMKTIEELENYRRGIYSGAIGYIAPDGNFDFNVVIRTAILKNSRLYYAVGGAITSDSDPQKEWEETLVKARALLNVRSNIEGE